MTKVILLKSVFVNPVDGPDAYGSPGQEYNLDDDDAQYLCDSEMAEVIDVSTKDGDGSVRTSSKRGRSKGIPKDRQRPGRQSNRSNGSGGRKASGKTNQP